VISVLAPTDPLPMTQLKQPPEPVPLDATAGSLDVRLAMNDADLAAAQALRYRVFYEERKAKPTEEMAQLKLDFDRFDPHCDHLLVIDHSLGEGQDNVVATYRVMRRKGALETGGFYTANEYDIDRLLQLDGEILELGRSCVDAHYRTRTCTNLLWKAIAQYVLHHDVLVMFGCGSLPGIDPEALASSLSYLHHFHMAPEDFRVKALPDLYTRMDLQDPEQLNPKRELAALPPLIKGYFRLGGFVGDGAVVDPQFNTTDVCVMVKTDLVTGKYFRHYTRDQDRESPGDSKDS